MTDWRGMRHSMMMAHTGEEMRARRSGILLHITSLPSPYGVGDLGEWAYRFADYLVEAGQSIWQVLPLNPTSSICGHSPYCSYSAFGGSPLLISPDLLIRDGLLRASDVENGPVFQEERVDYDVASAYKYLLLRIACERFRSSAGRDCEFDRFCRENAWWLDDYALFICVKAKFGHIVWRAWPAEVRDRADWALGGLREELREGIFAEKFFQYVLFRQWMALKKYCNSKNIQVVGDMPIYVSYDSADVWANPHLFKLNHDKSPMFVAGVPPDYFSSTGQLWGNPVYDWKRLQEYHYTWWVKRMEHNLKLFDMIRLDHFRGFVGYWEVPAGETTAINGEWVDAPAADFFNTLLRHFPYLPIIAEDLGIITADVREVMDAYGFPGMKLLLFAFGDDLAANPYVPHNHKMNCVVYTGTHDNNTALGWFTREAGESKERLFKYLGRRLNEDEVSWEFIRLALSSVASTAVVPFQDVLGLGEESRMNVPAVTYGNWAWRALPRQMTPDLASRLQEMTKIYGRH